MWNNPFVRFIAALLTIALAGPSIGSLVCDWTCAAKHQRAETSGGCHQRGTPGSAPGVAAGHLCHGVTAALASIATDARQPGISAPVPVEKPLTRSVDSAGDVPPRIPDAVQAPPPLLLSTSLRI
jgi:hypothetical protein